MRSVGRADHDRTLELGVVAPDRRARLGDEDVAGAELDVVGDRVRPRAARADLAPVARLHAVRRRELARRRRPRRSEQRERRLVPGAEARLRLGDAGSSRVLQEPVGMLAPARALADERDLGLALARQHRLDLHRERGDRGAGRLAQRRPVVAEDPGVAVLVGADAARRPRGRRARARGSASGARCPGTRGTTRRSRTSSPPGRARPRTPGRRRPWRRRALREDDGPFRREEPEPRRGSGCSARRRGRSPVEPAARTSSSRRSRRSSSSVAGIPVSGSVGSGGHRARSLHAAELPRSAKRR